MSALTPEQVEAASDVRRNWILGDFPVDLYIYVYAHQQAKIDALQAKLTTLEEQEPVGWVASGVLENGKWIGVISNKRMMGSYNTPLYSQPVPASPITREGCNYLAMQGTVCNKCGEVHK